MLNSAAQSSAAGISNTPHGAFYRLGVGLRRRPGSVDRLAGGVPATLWILFWTRGRHLRLFYYLGRLVALIRRAGGFAGG